jgi:general secretion pathway protein B
MSYILDALKKAERDRRRTHVPSIQTMHAEPREKHLVWPWIVGGALAINAIGFAALVFLRPQPAPIVPPAPSIASSQPSPTTTPTPESIAPSPHATAAATNASAPHLAVATPHTDVPESHASASTARATPSVVTKSATKRDDDATPRSSARAPSSRERAARVDPETLKLEVLIYSENAAERAVYISGQRYVEGQRVDPRLVVEQITSDSVVLAAGNKRYVLKQQ